jgi:putative transposase
MTNRAPFRYFKTSPEIIRLAVMLHIRFSLSLRNVEDLLHERGIEISHETVRYWWNRFGPTFTAELRRKRVDRMRGRNTGAGTSTRCLRRSTARRITSGGPSIMRVRFWKVWPPRPGIAR